MKRKDLKKFYPYDETDDSFILDLQLDNYNDAYSDWDFSPYTNRDLNEDLTEYLMDCSSEISLKYRIKIRFFILKQEEDQQREKNSIISINNYFRYQLKKQKNQRIDILRNIFRFFIIGVVLLVVSTYISEKNNSTFMSVLEEGLVIGAWVMIWEMFSSTFFKMKYINTKIAQFNRLCGAKIVFVIGDKRNSVIQKRD